MSQETSELQGERERAAAYGLSRLVALADAELKRHASRQDAAPDKEAAPVNRQAPVKATAEPDAKETAAPRRLGRK